MHTLTATATHGKRPNIHVLYVPHINKRKISVALAPLPLEAGFEPTDHDFVVDPIFHSEMLQHDRRVRRWTIPFTESLP